MHTRTSGIGPAAWLVVAVLAVAAGPAHGWDVSEIELVCPIDGKAFASWVNSSYSSLGIPDDELRPTLNGPIYEYNLHVCPRCGYAGFREHFPSGDKTPTLPQCLAMRDSLKEHVAGGKLMPSGHLFPLEEYELATVCFTARGAPADERAKLYLWGAWVADDAGEDAIAESYRRKAVSLLQEQLKELGRRGTDY